MPTIAPTLQPFADGKYARLTTYRRDGTGSGTPVTIAVEDGRAFVRTWDTTLKARRMRRNPVVEIAPCTARGTVRGPAVRARSRLLDGEEAAHAAHAIAHRQPILQGVLVPLTHRITHRRTIHYELIPISG
jgi:PPOX class probable F420-dependent enzyme